MGSTAFQVFSPAVGPFTSDSSGKIGVDYPGFGNANDVLHYGYFPNYGDGKPGIKWTVTVTAPNYNGEGGGVIAFFQRVNKDRRLTHDSGLKFKSVSNGFVADDPIPYIGSQRNINSGGTVTIGTQKTDPSDSPGLGLPSDFKKGSVNDRFELYLMYRLGSADALNTIWVPLAKLEWYWQGSASKLNNKWKLDSSNKSNNPTGSTTTYIPTWTRKASVIAFEPDQ
jgi:hypothetical protein